MHEQVASAVVIANALLDNFDIHTIAQDLPQARSYFRIFTSNSPSELRTSPLQVCATKVVRSNSFRYHVDVKLCDDNFSDSK